MPSSKASSLNCWTKGSRTRGMEDVFPDHRSLNFHLRKSQAGCGSVAGSAAVVRPGLEQS